MTHLKNFQVWMLELCSWYSLEMRIRHTLFRGIIMNRLQYASTLVLTFLLVGCMNSSTVSPSKMQTITLEDGKSYKVPVGAVYTKAAVTPKAIQFYKVMGVSNCKNGDITWEDPSISDKINKIMRSGTKQEGITMYVEAAKDGEIGCSSPLK